MKERPRFYKYKSLNDYEYLLDLILRERLYAARYDELNDPMEGVVKLDGTVPADSALEWDRLVSTLRISCFTKQSDDILMWAHYADGGRGCVVSFELFEDQKYHKVSYLKKPVLKKNDFNKEKAIEILKYKSKPWKYESEYRCIVESNYIPVKIKSIIFGSRANDESVNMLKHIIHLCKPSLDVYRIHRGKGTLVDTRIIKVRHGRIRVVSRGNSPSGCDKCKSNKISQDNFTYR